MRKLSLICAAAFAAPLLVGQILSPIIAGGRHAYYVDSVSGSDSNSGTSSAAPLQTITALVGKVPPAGSTINLHMDSVWREEFSSSKADLTIQSYGSGTNKPLLDGSNAISAGSWTKTGGLTNVYQVTITFEQGSTIDCINSFESGSFLTYKASTALVDSNAGSYTVSSCTTSPATLYVHATSGIPTTNGLTYEYTARNESINALVPSGTLRASGWKVNGIWTRRNADASGSIGLGRNGKILNSLIEQGSRHNLICSDGCDVEGTTVQYCYDETQSCILGVVNEVTPIGLGITVKNSTFHTSSTGAGSAFISHPDSGGTFGTATVDTVTVDGGGSGISWGSLGSASFNAYTGLAPGCGTGGTSCSITNSSLTTTGVLVNTGSQTVTVSNTTITPGTTNPAINVQAAGVTLQILSGSSITVGSGQTIILTNSSATGLHVTRTNSTFASASGSYQRDQLQGDSVIDASDFNTWNATMSGTNIYDYEFTTGLDLHSTPSQPYTLMARWNLGSAHVSGSNIPDLDGQSLNLTFPGGGNNPTSQTAGVSFAAGTQRLGGPTIAGLSATSPATTAHIVLQWTGTVSGLTAGVNPLDFHGAATWNAGGSAHHIRGQMGTLDTLSPNSTTAIDDGGWHMASVVDTGNSIFLYVDGVQQGTSTGGSSVSISPGSNTVVVGNNRFFSGGWTGLVAYVEFDKGAMTASQIAAAYTSAKSSLAAQGVTLP